MSKESAKKKLNDVKEKLKESAKKYEGLGDALEDSDSRLIGPRDDIEYQKIKKDIKESGDEE
jgi:hypothetical protein